MTPGTFLAVLVVLAPTFASSAAAQGRTGAVEFTAGWTGFADDGIVNETLVGAAGRIYVLPRVSIGPEVGYIQGLNHSHLTVTGNVTFDFLRPMNGQQRRVNPFVVIGAGLFQTRDKFRNETFTSSEGAFTAGGGIRAYLSDRIFVTGEARVGWEPHVRIAGTLGIQLGR